MRKVLVLLLLSGCFWSQTGEEEEVLSLSGKTLLSVTPSGTKVFWNEISFKEDTYRWAWGERIATPDTIFLTLEKGWEEGTYDLIYGDVLWAGQAGATKIRTWTLMTRITRSVYPRARDSNDPIVIVKRGNWYTLMGIGTFHEKGTTPKQVVTTHQFRGE
jgi:hypothetical protein